MQVFSVTLQTEIKVLGRAVEVHKAALMSRVFGRRLDTFEAARPRTRGYCVAGCAYLPFSFHRHQIILGVAWRLEVKRRTSVCVDGRSSADKSPLHESSGKFFAPLSLSLVVLLYEIRAKVGFGFDCGLCPRGNWWNVWICFLDVVVL